MSRRIAYLYLEDVYEEFRKRHVSQDSVATFASVPLSLNNEFKPVLKQQTVFYNEESSKREAGNQNASVLLQRVRNEVDDVKNIVVENIGIVEPPAPVLAEFLSVEKILQRGEKIELLVDKTDRMQQTALKFETSVSFLLAGICVLGLWLGQALETFYVVEECQEVGYDGFHSSCCAVLYRGLCLWWHQFP